MSLILTCPECATRYVAKAEGFDPPGRNVRCSRCDHMWFQEVAEPESYETLYELYEGEEEDGHSSTRDRSSAADERDLRPRAPRIPDFDEEISGRDAPSKRKRRLRRPRLSASSVSEPHFSHGPMDRTFSEPGRSKATSILVGFFLTIAILGSLASGLWVFKPEITRVLPSLNAVYAFLPDPARASQFEFRNTAYSRGYEEGEAVLIVSGELVNTSNDVLTVPEIRATLKADDGQEMDNWIFSLRGEDLEPGEAKYFESRRVNPPENADRLHLHVIETGQ